MDTFAARANAKTLPISPVGRKDWKRWLGEQSKATQAWLKSTGFEPDAGNVALVPGRDGALARVVLGLGSDAGSIAMWSYAALHGKLPKGRYAIDAELDAADANAAALGWALASYRFDRYKKSETNKKAGEPATLVWPARADRAAIERTRDATFLVRDLINTPAADLGPQELADKAVEIAGHYEAEVEVIVGEALLDANYPSIHAVGKGSPRAPRLVDLRWGDEDAPKLSLVGKGVVFDTGGLDIKTSGNMKLMKKDMGGAAMMLALAQMIMAANLPVRLRLLLPIVENSVSGESYRPLDVLDTRKGLTVEVGNTDAEGRLILSDALFEADSEQPDLLIDFATLTGAARVALGTDLPALFSSDDEVAAAILAAGDEVDDPLWRMPLFRGYRRQLDSKVADLNNISSSPYGGAIVAALFLQEFVGKSTKWVHVDAMAWNLAAKPGKPLGGEAMGIRAVFRMLEKRYGGGTDG
jgi:leucyl aminopeptidase